MLQFQLASVYVSVVMRMSVCRMEIAIKSDMDVQELKPALATGLSWLECQSVHHKVAGSRFSVRAHAWDVSSDPCWGVYRRHLM